MEVERTGASGGWRGMRGRRVALLLVVLAAIVVVQSVAIVASALTDRADAGLPVRTDHVVTWQLSSVAVWLALMPAVWVLAARLRPPRFGWPLAIALHVLASVAVSLAHVAAMVALRKLVYALGGETYVFAADVPAKLLYEYRKDAATYLQFAAFAALAQWWLAQPEGAVAEAPPRVLLVADGAVTHRVPAAEIDWAASAGNYVEIGWGERRLLHRATLTAVAEALGPGFARIHRGRIVRRDAVRRVETERSGDFAVTLASGEELRGSRRFRAEL